MKVTEHVENLLRRGRKPKELLQLGFPKSVVTMVRRQLREEKKAQRDKFPKGEKKLKEEQHEPTALPTQMAMQQDLLFLQGEVHKVKEQIVVVEATLDGTPALGLKNRFQCNCGASGFVALRVQCTKCGKETWWGWFPK